MIALPHIVPHMISELPLMAAIEAMVNSGTEEPANATRTRMSAQLIRVLTTAPILPKAIIVMPAMSSFIPATTWICKRVKKLGDTRARENMRGN